MKFLSVCSGIEAASQAWSTLGWEAVAFSEIEKFPAAVLQHHYPKVPNLGDMTQFKEWNLGSIDLLVGGTPCQSFSVAGLRKGMADPRGNLALVFLALLDRMRPRWVVWENVPGILSSRGGRDFGSFLGGLGELGYGWAYRVLDAQHFGVPQRRRRVFVVGHLGDWRRSAAVLFERESLSGDSPPSRKAGKGIAAATAPSLTASGRGVERTVESRGQDPVVAVAHGLNAKAGHYLDATAETFVAHSLRSDGFDASEDGTGRGTPLVCGTLAASGAGTERPAGQGNELDFCVIQDARGMRAASGGSSRSFIAASTVRRLTPRECERLQGFPDDYTLIPFRGRPAADGPRYKALGNSMAVPVMRWIGERIVAIEEIS